MAPASELASSLIDHIPILTSRLRKYKEQNLELELRHENLEEEIMRVKRSIAYKQKQQVRFVEQLPTDSSVGSISKSYKRQRTEVEPDTRVLRPRLGRVNDNASQHVEVNFPDSDQAVAMKRRGRVFSNVDIGSAAKL